VKRTYSGAHADMPNTVLPVGKAKMTSFFPQFFQRRFKALSERDRAAQKQRHTNELKMRIKLM
jgi:hypothetical protein